MLDTLAVPIVLAPLAGGPSTPELAAAVSERRRAGLPGRGLPERGRAGRADRAHAGADVAPVRREPVRARARGDARRVRGLRGRARGRGAGGRRAALRRRRLGGEARRCSSARRSRSSRSRSGCRRSDVIARVRATGAEAWVTVTSAEEARAAAHVDALVVQGAEAGGHRGSWVDTPDLTPIGLLALLQLIDAELPLVASGGIATAAAVARGARAGRERGAGRHGVPARARGRHLAGAPRRARHRRADRAHARVQRPARARHPQPLHGRAPRRAARLPRDPLRHGAGPRRRAQGRRRGADQPVGGRGARARRSRPPPRSCATRGGGQD